MSLDGFKSCRTAGLGARRLRPIFVEIAQPVPA
jgi:hypothetical protein